MPTEYRHVEVCDQELTFGEVAKYQSCTFHRCKIAMPDNYLSQTREQYPLVLSNIFTECSFTTLEAHRGSLGFERCLFADCKFESPAGPTLYSYAFYHCTFEGCGVVKATTCAFNSCRLMRQSERITFTECNLTNCTSHPRRMRSHNMVRCSGSNVPRPNYEEECVTVEKGKRYGSRPVGVELEFNEEPGHAIRRWQDEGGHDVHYDGSCGHEAVTKPIGKAEVEPTIKALCKALKADNNSADSRCGIHVHVDARDVTWPDMFRLLRVYSHVETSLYLLAGQSRWNNNYCGPCGKDYAEALANLDRKGLVLACAMNLGVSKSSGKKARQDMADGMGKDKKHGGRYRGLNLWPWIAGRANKAKDTTVEFRMHRNSLDADRVIGWVHLCRDMVDYACTHTNDEVERDIKAHKSPMRFLAKKVSPEQEAWIVKRLKDYRKAVPLDGKTARFFSFSTRQYMPHGAKNNRSQYEPHAIRGSATNYNDVHYREEESGLDISF